VFWRREGKSAFDAFAEVEPDIYIGTTYDLDEATLKCLHRRPHIKVALVASAWGPMADSIDRTTYPIVYVREDEKRLVERIGRPTVVFLHLTDHYLDDVLGGWRSVGATPLGLLNAADLFVYRQGTFDERLACDVAFVGGYWGYKARNLRKYLLPLCASDANPNLRVRIFGNSRWPVSQYLGEIREDRVRHQFVSATVCPNVSEPHSTDLGYDVVERPFKVLASGGFCISDYVEEAHHIFSPDELLMAQSPQEFRAAIYHFLAHPEDRLRYIEAGQKKVLAEHTYFERVAQLLRALGLPEEAQRVVATKTECFPEVGKA
jgi:hypothetical protein